MNKTDKIFFGGSTIALIICFSMLIYMCTIDVLHHFDEANKFEKYLNTRNIHSIAGTINSPSVIIEVSHDEFIQLLDTSTSVYRQHGNFYILAEANTIGFVYYTPYYVLGIET